MNKNYLMEYSSLEKPILVIITIIMFIISPILSIVPIIIGIYFKKNMYLFFSIFFGILSMLYIPNVEYDMARHWTLFEILKEISLETFFNYLLTQKDLIHPTILYISSKVIENPQSINLILTTIIYYIFFLSLKKLEVKNKNLNILIVLTYLLTIDFLSVISGVRTALSISFSIYGFILYEEKKSIWKGLLFLILGVMSHIFAIIFIPIFLLAIFIKNNRIIKSIFGLSIVFSIIFLKGDIFLKIINNLPYLNKYLNHISVYINGSQSHFLNYNLNFNGVLKF
ncbi:MAG: EpsG family protein, partial [Cetobacterium sp.]|uniref:EpsG family protein n=1 Tax=Cetobacterium sp. TaxID=2071632 RepID=UPI003EE66C48